jgi:2-keto-4-pentenoate hydratase
MTNRPTIVAEYIANAHSQRATYRNLPAEIAPKSVSEAYAAQDALAKIWTPTRGAVAGLKIATTTRIMQELMGIDHPCGGLIYANHIHQSPAAIAPSAFVHLVVECELAVRLNRDLPSADEPYDRGSIRAAVGSVMAAFELIEDRHAVYKETNALTLIADNAWNGGIVLGAERVVPVDQDLNNVAGTLAINGVAQKVGRTDDPMGALAWVANLAVSRGRPLKAGMVVITGSVIPTLPIGADEQFTFTLEGIGATEMTAR